MIQPSSFLNNYTEEAFKDFRTRVLLDSGFFESEEGSKPNFAYNLSTLTTNLDSDTQEFLKATGIKDNTTISHINNYVVKLKRFGLWSKMKALYPFVSDQRNVLRNTDTFSGWGLEGGTITGGFTDPLGGATAYRYTAVGTAGLWTSSPTMVISSSTKITYSFWIKSVSGNSMTAVLTDAYNVSPVYTINITGTWAYVTATLTLTSGNAGMYINVLSDPTNGFLIWRPQMEVGSVATTYQPTTAPSSIYTNHFKYNLKDPRDLDAAFRLTFSGGWQFSQLGATPNGTNGVADTKLAPATSLSTSSTHMSFYSRTNKNEGSYELAADGHYSMILYQNSFYVNFDTSGGYPAQFSLSDTRGYYIGSRLNNTNVDGFRNGVKVINNIGLPSNLGTGTVKIGNGNGPYYSSKECGLVSIGEGLTDSEATNLYYLTEELQANLKRNVSPYNSFRGILDEYPGAAAAYSLRRLSGSYGGPLVKVRRSSDNTEQDIFPTASGSLDTTSLLSFVGANNGFVTTWYDQSGGLNHLLQSDANKQPSVVTSGVVNTYGNRPNVTFDGVNDTMEKAFTITGTLNLIMLNRRTGVGTDGGTQFVTLFDGPLALNNSANVGYKNIASPTGIGLYPMNWNTDGDTLLFPQLSTLSPFVYSFLIPDTTGKTGYQFINNKTYSTTYTFNPSPANPVNLGGVRLYTGDSGGEAGKGECYEVILYNFDNSNANINIVDRINAYYNLYWDGSRKGLLDFYPNAAAAYSVRALSSSYRGPLIKVRRASDNTERDIFALQNGNLDTFTLATFCSGTDGFVTTWYDQSGSGRNATQSDALKQPQVVSSGSVISVNGKPSIQFDGTSDGLINTTFTNTNVNQFFVNQVISHSGFTGNSASVTLSDGLSAPAGLSFLTVYPYKVSKFSLFYNNTSVDFGTNSISSGQLSLTLQQTSSTNRSGYINSILLTTNTDNLSILDLNNIYLGANDLGQNFNGNIQETVLYLSNNSSNRTAIESNINTYYTIY